MPTNRWRCEPFAPARTFPGQITQERQVAVAKPAKTAAQGTIVLVHVVPLQQRDTLVSKQVLPPGWQAAVHDPSGAAILSRGVEARLLLHPQGNALRFVATTGQVPWRVVLRMSRVTHAQDLAAAGAWLVLALLAMSGLSHVVGRRGKRRLTRAVESLVDLRPPVSPPPIDIVDIRDARQVLGKALRERVSVTQVLRLRDEQLHRIFESTHDAIDTVDEQQLIVMVKPAAARVFGRPVGSFDALRGVSALSI